MKKLKSFFKKYPKVILFLGIILGLSFILYPLASQIYYDQLSETEVSDFQKAVEAIDPPELKKQNIELAEAYNEALEPNLKWEDPYSETEREEGVQTYARMLEVQEKIGVLYIPSINVALPIFAGTSERVLQKGVAHLEGTSLPIGGKNTHAVLTAHRGLPEARLFTDLDQMEIGDVFSVETIAGSLYYEVDEISVIEPTDTEAVMIVPNKDYITLLTCTPYMINSHRLIVRGVRIPAPADEIIEEVNHNQTKNLLYYLKTYWYYFLIIFVALIFMVIFTRYQMRKDE